MYADMLKRVEPLRNELSSLENAATGNKRRRNFLAVFDTPLPHVEILTLIYLIFTC